MYVRNDIYLHEDQRVNVWTRLKYFMQFMTYHKLSNDYYYYLTCIRRWMTI